MIWDVLVDGVSLTTEGTGVSDIQGLGGISGRDFYNTTTFGADGETSFIGGLSASTFSVTVLIDGVDRATGVIPEGSSAEAEAKANLMWLSGVLASDYLMNVQVVLPTRAGQTELQATLGCQAQLYTVGDPRWGASRDYCYVTLGFKNPATYFRPAGGGDLDSQGWKTINVPAGTTSLTLPTNVYAMNGFIEDAQFVITSGANAVKAVSIKSLNRGSGTANPELVVSSTRANGVIYANSSMAIDCKAHTVLHTSGGITESMVKYANWQGGRPGSMLRIGQPYQLETTFTPYTSGASMAGVSWQIKYRPSFI